MRHHIHCPRALRMLGATAALWLLAQAAPADEPAIEGYADYHAYRLQLELIAQSEFATLESLGTTLGRREVYLLTIGSRRPERRPALLIVGSVEPPHLLGSELAVRLARRLTQQAGSDEAVRRMLRRVTLYVIPRPAPDACEAFFRRPYLERSGNERPVDDDRDAETDEDGPDDLNGDGWITMMRVEDRTGPYIPHPDDDRVLIKADPKRDEHGRYALYVEGRDQDEDDRQGEDPPGGVAFNRNFTFRYGYFERGAGPHQVSEVETRAVADFAYSHPNIAAVLTFTPEDNLMRPWKPSPSDESKRIKTAVLEADTGYFNYVAEQYREIHGGEDPPESPRGRGSLSEWAYFHYGRWSFGCRGWWIPRVDLETERGAAEPPDAETSEEETLGGKATEEGAPSEENADKPSSDEKSAGRKSADKKAKEDKRGAEELNALRWFAQERLDGFVDWQPIEHPDYPGRTVEVGGFRPFLQLNPPADQLEPLAEKHCQFVRRLVELLPRLEVPEVKLEPLGEGVWRVTAVIVNRGYLPTVSQMGNTTREPHPLQANLQLPEGVALVTARARVQLPVLAGRGGKVEQTWYVRATTAEPGPLRIRVWSPSVGRAAKEFELAEPPKTAEETS